MRHSVSTEATFRLVFSSFFFSLISLLAFGEAEAQAQGDPSPGEESQLQEERRPARGGREYYYYRRGKKVSLKIDRTRVYLLLKADTRISTLKKVTREAGSRIQGLGRVDQFGSLILLKPLPEQPLVWVTIEGVDPGSPLSDHPELANAVLYEVPYCVQENRDPVAISHLVHVKLRSPRDLPALERLANRLKVEILGKRKFAPLWYTLACTKDSPGNALEIANELYLSGSFAVAEPDFLAEFRPQCRTGYLFHEQWNLEREQGLDLDTCGAWEITVGDPDVVVAVIDNGVCPHEDLPGLSTNRFEDALDHWEMPGNYGFHGTPCAGIIGAAHDNEGGAGIAPNVTLLSVWTESNVARPNGQVLFADGILWAFGEGEADILSCSLGHNQILSGAVEDAIDEVLENGREGRGAILVFAAGNTRGGPLVQPATYEHHQTLAVGAMNRSGERRSSSAVGPELDLVAPGERIVTTRCNDPGVLGNRYNWRFRDTSAAAPHVAGVAALVLSVDSELTREEVIEIIETEAQNLGNLGESPDHPHGPWNEEVGYGLVSAARSVESAFSTSAAVFAEDGPAAEPDARFAALEPPSSEASVFPRGILARGDFDGGSGLLAHREGVVLREREGHRGRREKPRVFAPGEHLVSRSGRTDPLRMLEVPFWARVVCSRLGDVEGDRVTLEGPGVYDLGSLRGSPLRLEVIDTTQFYLDTKELSESDYGRDGKAWRRYRVEVPESCCEARFESDAKQGNAGWYATYGKDRVVEVTLWVEKRSSFSPHNCIGVVLAKSAE